MRTNAAKCARWSLSSTVVIVLLFGWAGCGEAPQDDALFSLHDALFFDPANEPEPADSPGSGGGGGGGGGWGGIPIAAFAFDDGCSPIEDVLVKSGAGGVCKTDSAGYCSLSIGIYVDAAVITFAKKGFELGSRVVDLQEGDAPFVTMVMQEVADDYALIQPGKGGTIVFDRGSITFPPNAFSGVGEDALSTLVVRVRALDVAGTDILAAPGDFSAMTTTGDAVWLESYGMLSVELLDGKGKPVGFSKAGKADIELLVPEGVEVSTSRSVPAWHFDEKSGKWVEEGEWMVGPWSQDPERQVFKSTVRHFSWWNVDVPMEVTCVQGKVTLCDGSPVGGAQVLAVGNDYFAVLTDVTDGEGNFCVLARVGSSVTLSTTIFDGTTLLTTSRDNLSTPSTPGSCFGGGCMEVNLALPCEGDPGFNDKPKLCSL